MVDIQLQDITIWMIALTMFNYLILYRRNKFFGSIGYLLIGLLLYGIRTEFGYSQTIYGYIALFIFMGALVNLIYEITGALSRGGTKRMRDWFRFSKKR